MRIRNTGGLCWKTEIKLFVKNPIAISDRGDCVTSYSDFPDRHFFSPPVFLCPHDYYLKYCDAG